MEQLGNWHVSVTVKGGILHILGILMEYFCGELVDKEEQLLKVYMATLKQQSEKPEPETQLLANSFLGMTAFMKNFGRTIEDGADYIKPLYLYITKAMELVDMNRYDVPKCEYFLIFLHH